MLVRDLKYWRYRLISDQSGSTLVEFTLVLFVMLTMTFGIVEFGYAGYQWANAEAATQRGVRLAATRDAAIINIPDCGVGVTGVVLGQPCSTDAGSYNWSVTCNAGAGGANCNAATLALIVAEMQRSYPNVVAGDVNITFSGAGRGFQGLGRPVPIVTVGLSGLTFDFVVLDALIGLPNQINMPGFRASLTGEDLQGT
jgi:hypothetical protein